PVWSRDGSELYFVSGSTLMVVGVERSAAFHTDVPRPPFSGGFHLSHPPRRPRAPPQRPLPPLPPPAPPLRRRTRRPLRGGQPEDDRHHTAPTGGPGRLVRRRSGGQGVSMTAMETR